MKLEKPNNYYPIAIQNYERIGQIVLDFCPRDSNILDWGGGSGILSSILRSNDRVTTIADYNSPDYNSWPNIRSNKYYKIDGFVLPFENESFDCVISCGVLEHSAKIRISLDEIYRIIRPYGALLIFHFPLKYSWTEFIARIRGISPHPLRFSMNELTQLSMEHGFECISSWRYNMLPKTLYGLPQVYLNIYSKFSFHIHTVDKLLSSIFILNRIANSIEGKFMKVPYFENKNNYPIKSKLNWSKSICGDG